MFSATLSNLWSFPLREATTTEPPRKRPGPLFIGDTVQPWGGETMLLALLRDEASQGDEHS